MRIAQVAPLYESVPPQLYGGTERVVHYLTEELVAMGHEVTLFASGDSTTRARLIAPVDQALRLSGSRDTVTPHVLLLENVLTRIDEFDIIHFHTDAWHMPFARRMPVPCITTLHGRLDYPEILPVFWEFRDHPLVSISDAQRLPMPWANWQATVYHGLPRDLLPFSSSSQGYLAFTGRISPEKRPDLAIAIAQKLGMPLRIAAKVDDVDRDYFERLIRPLLGLSGVEFIGEINEEQKADFLGNAAALLFPIDWPEPFGLVMIEAMSCGTPVVAMRRGSVPEVVDHGHSGMIVGSAAISAEASIDLAVAATLEALQLSRRHVRETFENRFTSHRMAADYITVYRRLIAASTNTAAASTSTPHPHHAPSKAHTAPHRSARPTPAYRPNNAHAVPSFARTSTNRPMSPLPESIPPDVAAGVEHGRSR